MANQYTQICIDALYVPLAPKVDNVCVHSAGDFHINTNVKPGERVEAADVTVSRRRDPLE